MFEFLQEHLILLTYLLFCLIMSAYLVMFQIGLCYNMQSGLMILSLTPRLIVNVMVARVGWGVGGVGGWSVTLSLGFLPILLVCMSVIQTK